MAKTLLCEYPVRPPQAELGLLVLGAWRQQDRKVCGLELSGICLACWFAVVLVFTEPHGEGSSG